MHKLEKFLRKTVDKFNLKLDEFIKKKFNLLFF